MTVRLIKVPRASVLGLCPLWAVGLMSLWVAFVGVTVLAGIGNQCLFKRFTGVPCPTCGSTRAIFALLHGHPVQAWLFNPLVMTVVPALVAAIALRGLGGRHLEVTFTPRGRALTRALAIGGFVANWIYVILVVG